MSYFHCNQAKQLDLENQSLRAEVERLQHINAELLKQKDGVDKDVFGVVCFERDEALAQFAKLQETVKTLYYAAWWEADRSVDEQVLWERVRDAAGLVPGMSAEIIGPRQQPTTKEALAQVATSEKTIRNLMLACETLMDEVTHRYQSQKDRLHPSRFTLGKWTSA